jgi:hypothetical protein
VRRARLVVLLTAAAIVASIPGVAWASWSAGAVGSASAVAFLMPAGDTPSASAAGRNVDVSWPQSTFPNADPVGGYVVSRYDVLTGTPQTVGAGCDGVVTADACTEADVPPGQWSYTVRPVHEGWTGTEGPSSATVAVESPLLSLAPTTITSLPATLTGVVSGFLTGETVTFRLDDPGSGTVLVGSITPDPIPGDGTASVSVTIPGGTSLGSHTVFAVGSLGTVAAAAVDVVDATVPTITALAIGKSEGGTTGYVRQGGTYYVYANVADPGDPASGVATVTADVSAVTTGQTAVPLVAGSYTAGGVSYNYGSAALTASNPLSAGTKAFTVSSTDTAGNPATPAASSVVVDNTRPSASDIQTANASGGTVGRAETGDTITFTFSERMEPGSFLAGWDGSAATVTVRLVNNASNDRILIRDAADANQLPFGTVNLGRTDYTASTRRFLSSTMVMSGSTIVVTLGTPNGAVTTAAGNGTMTWSPVATPYDLAGNLHTTTARTERGAADREF